MPQQMDFDDIQHFLVARTPALAARYFGVCDMALEVYGSPSAELVKVTAGLAPKIYSPFQSI